MFFKMNRNRDPYVDLLFRTVSEEDKIKMDKCYADEYIRHTEHFVSFEEWKNNKIIADLDYVRQIQIGLICGGYPEDVVDKYLMFINRDYEKLMERMNGK